MRTPVYAEYFADPFVWRDGDAFYAIGTGAAEAAGGKSGEGQQRVFPLLRSRDLTAWRAVGRALVRPEPSLGDTFWAPEVAFADGAWHLFYSVGHGEKRHHIRVATSENVEGPYVDRAALTDPDDVPFAIDAHPFHDDDGRWYLFQARDFLEPSDEHRVGTGLVVQEMREMTRLVGEPRVVLRPRYEWQCYQRQRAMYGNVYDWHTVEGPFVIKQDGLYWCLYSGGCWQNPTYGVDYVVAEHVLGPWRVRGDASAPRVLRTIENDVIGPGHCSVVVGPDQKRKIVFHAWDAFMTARRMYIDDLELEAPR